MMQFDFISFAVDYDIMKDMVIPRYIKKLFWDTGPERVDKEKHKDYIIVRMLNYGTPESIMWLMVDVFYFADGTGLALQIGHRLSEDPGFFSDSELSTDRLYQVLKSLTYFEDAKRDPKVITKEKLSGKRLKVILSLIYSNSKGIL